MSRTIILFHKHLLFYFCRKRSSLIWKTLSSLNLWVSWKKTCRKAVENISSETPYVLNKHLIAFLFRCLNIECQTYFSPNQNKLKNVLLHVQLQAWELLYSNIEKCHTKSNTSLSVFHQLCLNRMIYSITLQESPHIHSYVSSRKSLIYAVWVE